VGERREEEIAEIVAGETAAGVETILEKLGEEGFIFGEGDHAVANISGREHAIFATKTAGAAAVIGDGDDRGEIGDGPLGGGLLIAAAHDVLLEAAEKSGEAGTPAESNNADASDCVFV
jgi:hypothetical protein